MKLIQRHDFNLQTLRGSRTEGVLRPLIFLSTEGPGLVIAVRRMQAQVRFTQIIGTVENLLDRGAHMTRPSLSIRRLMFTVAVFTILCAYAKHWIRYSVMASGCLTRALQHVTNLEVQPNGARIYSGTKTFFRLTRKADEYDYAKWRPWVYVEPDPLEALPEFW